VTVLENQAHIYLSLAMKKLNKKMPRQLQWALIAVSGCLMGVSVAAPARADLFSRDLLGVGDGLVTQDTRTGLEWLDYNVTNGLSYEQVMQGEKDLTTKLGFRYATLGEIEEFVKSADLYGRSTPGFFPEPRPDYIVRIEQSGAYAGKALTSFLGIGGSRVGSSFGGSSIYFGSLKYGQFDPVSQKMPFFGISYSETSGTIIDPASPISGSFSAGNFPYGIRDWGTGNGPGGGEASFLVRDIWIAPPIDPQKTPEPASLMMLVGTVGVMAIGRKKNDR
jgi:hypothetical protein